MDPKTHVLDHPLIQHKVAILRKQQTGAKEFREIVSEIAMLMCYEATRDLPLQKAQRGINMGLLRREIPGGLIAHQHGDLGNQLAEFLGAGQVFAKDGDVGVDEGMIERLAIIDISEPTRQYQV